MADTTSPDNIVKWTGTDAASLTAESQAQGDSIQNALNKRQRYDYVWPTATERGAQTGMVQGSRGYQVDTRSEYIYDNSNWRLDTSYALYTHPNQAFASGVEALITTPSIDNALSTDLTFTSPIAGGITLVNPGVYIVSWIVVSSVSSNNPYIKISLDSAGSNIIALNAQTGVIGMTSTPLNTTAANTPIYFRIRQAVTASETYSGTIRIMRIG